MSGKRRADPEGRRKKSKKKARTQPRDEGEGHTPQDAVPAPVTKPVRRDRSSGSESGGSAGEPVVSQPRRVTPEPVYSDPLRVVFLDGTYYQLCPYRDETPEDSVHIYSRPRTRGPVQHGRPRTRSSQ